MMDSQISGTADDESVEALSTEIYTPELDGELMQASGELDENAASDEPTEVSSVSEQPEMSVDDAATEFYDPEHDQDLSDLRKPSVTESIDSQILDVAEDDSAEALSTEIYTPELDDELMQASGELDENVASDEPTEVPNVSEQPEMSVDDAATEFYDPKHDEDLSDLRKPSVSESSDSQMLDVAEDDSAEALSTDIYISELDDELTLGSEVTDTSETQASSETKEVNFDNERAEEPTEIESILGEIPDAVSSEQQEVSVEADNSNEPAYWSQEDTFVGEVERLSFNSDSEDQAFDITEEVSTKLDLAKAYIDMGDAEGARSTLEEVMKEGDDEQCKAAGELMKKIA
jgi:pilus assembly protein FimV